MDNLRDLLKKFIELEQNEKNSSAKSQDNILLDERIRNFGCNPDAIRDIVNDLPHDANTDSIVETILKTIGKEITYRKPMMISDTGFISRSVHTKETNEGLERQVEKPLIISACGRTMKEEEIGVRCSICSQYDEKEHAFVCHRCGHGLCILHTSFFKNEKGDNVPYCPACYKEVIYNQYMW